MKGSKGLPLLVFAFILQAKGVSGVVASASDLYLKHVVAIGEGFSRLCSFRCSSLSLSYLLLATWRLNA